MAISFLQLDGPLGEQLGGQPGDAVSDDKHTSPPAPEDAPWAAPGALPPLPLEVPAGFSLHVCVRRSPLARLAPAAWLEPSGGADPSTGALATGALRLVLAPAAIGRAPLEVVLTQPGGAGSPLLVHGLTAVPTAREQQDEQLGLLRGMLRLDEDYQLFYRLASEDPALAWAPALDAARALRSATAFEDLAKCLLLGGAAEARAQALCEALCALGAPTRSGRRAFPQAAELCAVSVEALRELGLGRLARPLHRLATLCASGTLHAEALRRGPGQLAQALAAAEDADDEAAWDDLVGEELEWQERVRSLLEWLPGFGEQAVGEMQLLLGCYEDVQLHRRARAAFRRRFPSKPRRRASSAATAPAVEGGAGAEHPARQEEVLLIRRMLRRLEPYGLYRGLAQALLACAGLGDEEAGPARGPRRAMKRGGGRSAAASGGEEATPADGAKICPARGAAL